MGGSEKETQAYSGWCKTQIITLWVILNMKNHLMDADLMGGVLHKKEVLMGNVKKRELEI